MRADVQSQGYSLNSLYRVVGVSKQAVSQHNKRQAHRAMATECLRAEVDVIRVDHPGCGLAKMHGMIEPGWLGRDRFVSLFQRLGYGLKRVRNRARTTYSVKGLYYPNLTSGLKIRSPDRVWQTDITYYRLPGGYCYLTFIIDVYSRMIVGYAVSDRLRAEANIKALKKAFRYRQGSSLDGLIHHSDKGSQYIDKGYKGLLASRGVAISMCDSPQENAYTERLNGTIKNEYLAYRTINSLSSLKYHVDKAVKHYNTFRPHNSLPGRCSPVAFERYLDGCAAEQWPEMVIHDYARQGMEAPGNRCSFSPPS